MYRIILFLVVSVGIIYFSRRSLLDVRSYGFYRFIAFESILVILLLNIGFWFDEPFSLRQIVSWVFLCATLPLVLGGVLRLRRHGKVRDGFQNTTALETRGIYAYVRHPMYSSLLFLAWGAFLKGMSVWTGLLVILASASLYATARMEEKLNRKRFGDAYEVYRRETRMFIPFLL